MRLLLAFLMLAAVLVPSSASAQSCVPNPLASLPDPGRFVMLNPCVDATGTVAMGDIPRPYGAYRVTLKLDPGSLWLLPPGIERDDGLIWVKLYPLVYPVRVPIEGERVQITGALVLDPDWGWRTIAPVWVMNVLAPALPRPTHLTLNVGSIPVGSTTLWVVTLWNATGVTISNVSLGVGSSHWTIPTISNGTGAGPFNVYALSPPRVVLRYAGYEQIIPGTMATTPVAIER